MDQWSVSLSGRVHFMAQSTGLVSRRLKSPASPVKDSKEEGDVKDCSPNDPGKLLRIWVNNIDLDGQIVWLTVRKFLMSIAQRWRTWLVCPKYLVQSQAAPVKAVERTVDVKEHRLRDRGESLPTGGHSINQHGCLNVWLSIKAASKFVI